ncbi:hypothetical protein [Amphibacillus cookii]|uniref:hypothetical protein n=1 Tax=Amphibacillus cookii TaxID=767787 RepID=UPI001EF87D2F|nr:hypothetical protein [Amphibacillus cookii]MBM7542113.1 hypothetical protein [Amphibacillus cookii]
MSYQEKKTIVSILTGLLILTTYCFYAYGKYQSGVVAMDDLMFWARTMLLFIAISIVATIVIQIVFNILLSIMIAIQEKASGCESDDKEIEKTIETEMVTDEMDRLIELKSMRIGFFFAGIGFVIALIAVVLDYSAAVMIQIIFISFHIGSLLEAITQLYFYRKGIKHG